MGKRQRLSATADHLVSVVCTALKTKNEEVKHCISYVQRQASEIMTLSTKLGCLFIMESIHQVENVDISLFADQTFWRYCTPAHRAYAGR
jgi:hypothetical protein